MNSIYDSWPWFVSGPAIALVLFLLLMMGKRFGMSSNLRTLCTICGAGKKVEFFKPSASRGESRETYIHCYSLKTL